MKKFILVITFILAACFINYELFITLPNIWPDEALNADIANNIITQGRYGTDLWKGIEPGAEKCACWNPGMTIASQAIWFKFFGFSVTNQRGLSLFVGTLFLITFYLTSRKIMQMAFFPKSINHLFYFLPLLALMVDYAFLIATRFGRPEIFVLFWGTLAVFLLLKYYESESAKKAKRFLFFSGVCATLAFLNHFIALFFGTVILICLIFIKKNNDLKIRRFLPFILGVVTPLTLWGILMFPNRNYIIEQIGFAFSRKRNEISWFWESLISLPFVYRAIYLLFYLSTIVFTIFTILKKKKEYLIILLLSLVSWFFVFTSKMLWYYSLPVPFTYLGLSLIVADAFYHKNTDSQNKLFTVLGISLIALLSFLNFKVNLANIALTDRSRLYYNNYSQNILEYLPEGKSVFLSVEPDPYFAIKARGKNEILEFPGVILTKNDYLKFLGMVDYIIINKEYDMVINGDFLIKYIDSNDEDASEIEITAGQSVWIIKLKPRDKRVMP